MTPWTEAYQVPPSMGFSRQEYWSGLPFPSPGDLPDPGIETRSPTLQADALPSEPPGKPKNVDHFILKLPLGFQDAISSCLILSSLVTPCQSFSDHLRLFPQNSILSPIQYCNLSEILLGYII